VVVRALLLGAMLGAALAGPLTGWAAVGSAALVVPLYLSEIAPTEIRGRIASLNQLELLAKPNLTEASSCPGIAGAGSTIHRQNSL
jgi:sugar transport protein